MPTRANALPLHVTNNQFYSWTLISIIPVSILDCKVQKLTLGNIRGKKNCEQLRELWEGGRTRLEEISRDKGRAAVLSSAKLHQDHAGKDTAVYTAVWATRQLLRPLLVSPPPATYHQSSEICSLVLYEQYLLSVFVWLTQDSRFQSRQNLYLPLE